MDLLASKLAQDLKGTKKSTKKNKKLSKDDSIKSKKHVPKVNDKTIVKPSKKLKSEPNLTNISSKKKQLIKATLIKGKKDESKDLVKNDTNILKKKEKKNIAKSLKNKLPELKIGSKIKKANDVLKNKAENLEDTNTKCDIDVKKGIKTKKIKNESTNNVNNQKKLKLSKKSVVNVEKTKENEEINNIKSKKRKQLDTETEESQNKTTSHLEGKEVQKYVKALLKVVDKEEQKQKNLFDTEKPPIFLHVTCFKIPRVPLHQMRTTLPHSMVSPNDDIALFVKDLKKGRRINYENTVHHYEDLLEKHGCTQVKTVIPFNQVKTEYRQYEMRRRLFNSYDYFLVDGRIAGHMAHVLGKLFREKRKLPISIHMDKKDLKAEIDTALRKTSLQIHSNGDTSITQIGTGSMNSKQITDNIMAVVKNLCENFPGGWENIRSLRIKTPLSLAIPIYISLKNRNDVKVPVQTPKRPKAYQDVEGELSTFTSNVNVIVAPDGTVNVQKIGDDGSDISDGIDEDDDIDEDNDEDDVNENNKSNNENEDEEDDNEEDDDDDDEDEDDENEDD